MQDFISTQRTKAQVEDHHQNLEVDLVFKFAVENANVGKKEREDFKNELVAGIRSSKKNILTDFEKSASYSQNANVQEFGKISYDKNQELGAGSNGKVYKGVYANSVTSTARKIAVKRLDFEKTNRNSVIAEIEVLIKCDAYKNVVRYFGEEHTEDFILLALELCDFSLEQWVQRKGAHEIANISQLAVLEQATEGLTYLHYCNVIHRDIKPQNILLRIDSGSKEVVVKISDFGLCKILPDGRSNQTMTSGVGSEGWMAPETLRFLEEEGVHAKWAS